MIVDCALYGHGRRLATLAIDQVAGALRDPDVFVWVGLKDPTHEEFDEVRRVFGLHPLACEDAVKAHQRPKLEHYDESTFVVLKTCRYLDAEEEVEFGEIQVFIGDRFVVHVRHGDATPLHAARLRLERQPDLLALGPSAVFYAVLDQVVDDYEPVAAGLANDVDEVELQVFGDGPRSQAPTERIYFLKREVLSALAALVPTEVVLGDLVQGRVDFVADGAKVWFRDVDDHLRRIIDGLRAGNELLSSALTANLTLVSVQQNEDMRKISAYAALIAVPTLIAGIYGMNFEGMPELRWHLGYPMALAGMAAVVLVLWRAFKRSGWV